MTKEQVSSEEKKGKVHKPEQQEVDKGHDGGVSSEAPLISLQQQVGNQAVQRLVAQRSASGPTELEPYGLRVLKRED